MARSRGHAHEHRLFKKIFIETAGAAVPAKGPEVILTSQRFTYDNPDAPADTKLGSQIEDVEIHYRVPYRDRVQNYFRIGDDQRNRCRSTMAFTL